MEHTTIFKCVSGSRAYGFSNKDSDVDLRGIFMPNPECFYGLTNYKDPIETTNPDKVLYSLKKFVNLALANNPNVLELLYVDSPDLIIESCEYINKIKNIRKEFLSKRIFKTYLGYVKAQMHKLKLGGNIGSITNEKRAYNISKFGYDLKAASHVLRLLFQGIGLAREKHISIPLTKGEAHVCRIIREGKIDFKDFVEDTNGYIELFKILERDTDLPDEPNFELVNDLVMNINKSFYEGK